MKKTTLALATFTLISLYACDSCPDGFSGEDCEIESRQNFIGIWNSDDYTCALGEPIQLQINEADEIDEISMNFVGGPSDQFRAEVEDNDFNFDSDTLDISGTLTGDLLVFRLFRPENNISCIGSFRP